MNDEQLLRQWARRIHFLYFIQFVYFFLFITSYVYIQRYMDKINVSDKHRCQSVTKINFLQSSSNETGPYMKRAKQGPLVVNLSEKMRMKRSNGLKNSRIPDWTLIFADNTIIPKKVLDRCCGRIHEYCGEKERKLRGYPGFEGHSGARGGRGMTGQRGDRGGAGPPGLVGRPGAVGQPGTPGRCNCTFPDLFVQRVTVPGPPIIKIEEKTVPVPLVVVKEIEVTKLVPFEPTPPGFTPPAGWSPGMGRPNFTHLASINRTVFVTKHQSVLTVQPDQLQATNATLPTDTTAANETIANMTRRLTTESPITTTPYTGPPTLGYNSAECILDAVGIPVLHAESQYGPVGSWMRDSSPSDEEMTAKRWVTDEYASPVLYEYKDERQLMNKKQKIKYYVDYLASGTGNIVYNGSYFYHRHGSHYLIRYDLNSTEQWTHYLDAIAHLDCSRKPDHTFELCNETDRDAWLYDKPHNYVDYAVDENGLWVVYMYRNNPHLIVSKIEPDFYIVKTWEMKGINGTQLANTFIMCGVLYGLESSNRRDTYISFAYDLFRDRPIPAVKVHWYNPYQANTMLDYNPVDRRLYFYDATRLLSVNVRTTAQPPPTAPLHQSLDINDTISNSY